MRGITYRIVMADTAYDADHLRQAIAAEGALAVIPNNPSLALKYPLEPAGCGYGNVGSKIPGFFP